ncbi:uncharacterized protein LOC112029415 [Quercus suber]|uniref:uncharacterized protein LOC112029415 n=1 Tax=Quercus suber TaxID=58331 RepID=UPI0032DF983E
MVPVHSPAIMIIMETKVCGDRARRIVDRLPMDGAIIANSIGLSSGLWLLWDSSQVDVVELSSTKQEIHATVSFSSKPLWLLSSIHGSPRFAERCLLWENLNSIAELHAMPWVIAGDFNEVLMGDDKFGGRLVNLGKALRFQECLDNYNMIDIGFSRPRYTWSNRRPLSRLIQERIDRVFLNAEWNSLYPEAAVFHLEMTESDHCPVKLCMDNNRTVQFLKPFRFQPMWLSHPSFSGVVRDAWSSQPTLMQAHSSFTAKANAWNKTEFGNLFHRKRRILARLRGIQENLSFRPNDFLVDLERKLRIEYVEVTKLEEEFWAMKARILWLVEGDHNIAFYHTSALVRRRRNHILCMKDRVRNWLNGDREIADFIRKGFMELFTSDLCSVSLTD